MSHKYIIVRPSGFALETHLYERVNYKTAKEHAPEYRFVASGRADKMLTVCEQLNNPAPPEKENIRDEGNLTDE